jgi:hypothetical protein
MGESASIAASSVLEYPLRSALAVSWQDSGDTSAVWGRGLCVLDGSGLRLSERDSRLRNEGMGAQKGPRGGGESIGTTFI